MDAWLFLITAENLAKGQLESDRRTSVSRSYYGALNAILCSLRPHGGCPRREYTHDLGQWLRACDDTNLRQAGQKLGTLKSMRIDADYAMDKPEASFGAAQTRMALREAKEALRLFRTVSDKKAADRVRAYLGKTNQLDRLESAVRIGRAPS